VGRARLQRSSSGDTVWDHDHRNGLRHFGRTPGCGYNPERSINTVSIGDDIDWNRTRHPARRNLFIINMTEQKFDCDRLIACQCIVNI